MICKNGLKWALEGVILCPDWCYKFVTIGQKKTKNKVTNLNYIKYGVTLAYIKGLNRISENNSRKSKVTKSQENMI